MVEPGTCPEHCISLQDIFTVNGCTETFHSLIFLRRTAVTTHAVFQRCLDVSVAVKEKLLISNLRSQTTSCITRLSGLWCRILINVLFFFFWCPGATVCRYCSIQHVLTDVCASHERYFFFFTCWPNEGGCWWCINMSERYVCGGSYFHKCMRMI